MLKKLFLFLLLFPGFAFASEGLKYPSFIPDTPSTFNILNNHYGLPNCTGDGITDDSSTLNQATTYCMANKLTMVIPGGHTYIVNAAPWEIEQTNAAGTTFNFVNFTAMGYYSKGNFNIGMPVIKCTNAALPACTIHKSRGVWLDGIEFVGVNTAIGGGTSPPSFALYLAKGVSWINNSARDSQNSPHAGIVIDPYAGTNTFPTDGGYPALSARYGIFGGADSANIRISNCTIIDFTVGILNGANGINFGDNSVIVDGCQIANNKVDIAEGSNQADGNMANNCSDGACYCFFDSTDYGSKSGRSWTFVGGEINDPKWLVKTAAGNISQTLLFMGIHMEGVGSLGFFQNTTPNAIFIEDEVGFEDMSGNGFSELDSQAVGQFSMKQGSVGISSASGTFVARGIWNTSTAIGLKCSLEGLALSNNATLANGIDGSWVSMDNNNQCAFSYNNCIVASQNRRLFDNNISNTAYNNLAGFPVAPGANLSFSDTQSNFKVASEYNTFLLNHSGGATIIGSGNGAATMVISATDAFAVTVGDAIFCSAGYPSEDVTEGNSLTNYSPAAIVSTQDATGVTLGLTRVPQDVTGATSFGTAPTVKWMAKWHKNLLATITNASVTVTLPSTSDWTSGDHVAGFGVVSGTRISQVLNSTTLILSKAANFSGASPATSYLTDAVYKTTTPLTQNGTNDQVQPNPIVPVLAGLSLTSATAYFIYGGTSNLPVTIQHIIATALVGGTNSSVEVGVFSGTGAPSNTNQTLTKIASGVCGTTLSINASFQNTSNLNCVVPPNTPIYYGVLISDTIAPTLGGATDTTGSGYLTSFASAGTFASTSTYATTRTAYGGSAAVGVMLNASQF